VSIDKFKLQEEINKMKRYAHYILATNIFSCVGFTIIKSGYINNGVILVDEHEERLKTIEEIAGSLVVITSPYRNANQVLSQLSNLKRIRGKSVPWISQFNCQQQSSYLCTE